MTTTDAIARHFRFAIGLLAWLLVLGCGYASPVGTPVRTATNPVATLTPSPSASAFPSPAPPSATSQSDPGPPPAPAELVLPDGTRTAAFVGSWCFGGTCAEIPAVEPAQMPDVTLPGPGIDLDARLPNAYRFWSWSASYGPAAQLGGWDTLLARGGTVVDPDAVPPGADSPIPELTSAQFEGPPSGDQVLALYVQFVRGGDAIYYWHAIVP